MPYFMNFVRIPKAGKSFEVLEAMKTAHAATGRPGNITVPVGGANQNNPRPGLISLVGGFATLDDVDAMQTAYLSNLEMQKGQMAIEELCDKTNYIVSEMLAGPEFPDGYEPTTVSRLSMTAKPGKVQELIEILLEVRDKVGGDSKNVISRSITGSIGSVRVSAFGTSLQDLDDKRVETLKHVGRIPELISANPIRHLGRIAYTSRG